MAKKKIVDDGYVPSDVKVQVSIQPAFKIVIAEKDSNGDSWSGHVWYGGTAVDALRDMRNTIETKQAVIDGKVRKQYGDVRVTTRDNALVAATGWKEATFDDTYARADRDGGNDTRPDERVVG